MSKIFISATFKGVKSDHSPAKSDRKPIDDLSDRNEADPKAKSTESAQTRNEVQQSHLWRSFKLWNTDCKVIMPKMKTHQTLWDPQKRCSRWQYPFHRRCTAISPKEKCLQGASLTVPPNFQYQNGKNLISFLGHRIAQSIRSCFMLIFLNLALVGCRSFSFWY